LRERRKKAILDQTLAVRTIDVPPLHWSIARDLFELVPVPCRRHCVCRFFSRGAGIFEKSLNWFRIWETCNRIWKRPFIFSVSPRRFRFTCSAANAPMTII
jgi:hypothetical protein